MSFHFTHPNPTSHLGGSRVDNDEEGEEGEGGLGANCAANSYQMHPAPEGCCTTDGESANLAGYIPIHVPGAQGMYVGVLSSTRTMKSRLATESSDNNSEVTTSSLATRRKFIPARPEVSLVSPRVMKFTWAITGPCSGNMEIKGPNLIFWELEHSQCRGVSRLRSNSCQDEEVGKGLLEERSFFLWVLEDW